MRPPYLPRPVLQLVADEITHRGCPFFGVLLGCRLDVPRGGCACTNRHNARNVGTGESRSSVLSNKQIARPARAKVLGLLDALVGVSRDAALAANVLHKVLGRSKVITRRACSKRHHPCAAGAWRCCWSGQPFATAASWKIRGLHAQLCRPNPPCGSPGRWHWR